MEPLTSPSRREFLKAGAAVSGGLVLGIALPDPFARSAGAAEAAWTPNAWMLGEYNCEQQVGGPGGAASNYGLVEDESAPQ